MVHPSGHRTRGDARLICDHEDAIPLTKYLAEDDIILMLTPVVRPPPGSANIGSDPFEPLGLAINARHPCIHHVPYTKKGGITPEIIRHIQTAQVVIFVISGMPSPGEPSQLEYAKVVRAACEKRRQIVLACGTESGFLRSGSFPAIIQAKDYHPRDLSAAAAILFGENPATEVLPPPPGLETEKPWKTREWDPSLIRPLQELWQQCLPAKFHLPNEVILSLLVREGYSKHWVVRDLDDPNVLLGFCASFVTFKNKSQEELVGSVALILVRPGYRNRGIGMELHAQALRFLKHLKGVNRIQLGSMFPRLLYGIPSDLSGVDWGWFERRGWVVNGGTPGKGQEVCDWLIKFDDLPKQSLAPSGLTIRWCGYCEIDIVLDFVYKVSSKQESMSWFDQYLHLWWHRDFVETNILVGLEGDRMVATALVYTPNDGSPPARDLPWPAKLGPRVGGITCICIEGTHCCFV